MIMQLKQEVKKDGYINITKQMTSTANPPPFKDLVKSLMLANLAYIDQIDKITQVIGYPKVTFINGSDKDTQLYLLNEGRNLFVIFRGTSSFEDCVNDIEAVKWDKVTFDSNIKVHHGFHLQYKAVEDELVSFLNNNHTSYDTVTFCGHSLGAALATIATVYYYYNNSDPNNPNATHYTNKTVKVQTYGCPRVGDAAFGQYYSLCVRPENHWRVFNETDPAAKYPSQTTIFSSDVYIHVPGNSLSLIGSTDPISYEVTQSDNEENLPVTFVFQLDQHHTALYMSRILSLYDQQETKQTVVEVLDAVVEDVINQEEQAAAAAASSANKQSSAGGCTIC